ncbi:MAG: tRNA lysidine(34) synthetase TilS, partial [Candidatus Cloacimonetes bacterium]|nr:tRNA lysidine(34) synthetase TilS [Candidatus Cloacimonadota bacterium]
MANTQKFLDKLEDFIIRNRIIRRDDKILVGFSGGADSTALTLGLWYLRSKLNFTLLAAHVNYQLRGNDSEADREFVKQFCFDRNISLVIKDIKLEPGANLENRAREIRFTYFNELSRQYLVDKILLGHNRMDQTETFLFHLIRGAGYTGLKGIAPVTGNIAHPLIEFSRAEIENFLKKKNISWREDLSNRETKFSRNKIRHELIPWIESNLNNRVVDKITET